MLAGIPLDQLERFRYRSIKSRYADRQIKAGKKCSDYYSKGLPFGFPVHGSIFSKKFIYKHKLQISPFGRDDKRVG